MSLFASWLLIQGVAWTPGGIWDGLQQPQGPVGQMRWSSLVTLQNSEIQKNKSAN